MDLHEEEDQPIVLPARENVDIPVLAVSKNVSFKRFHNCLVIYCTPACNFFYGVFFMKNRCFAMNCFLLALKNVES